jgi:hypothetical protein
MPGYPTIPTRDAFGPTRIDDGIPPDDPRYVDASTFNLAFWQLAGLGVCSPRAYVRLSFASGVATLEEHGEAWAPNGDGVAPTLTKTGTGAWTVEYAASYTDEQGTSAALAFRFAMPVRNSPNDDDTAQVTISPAQQANLANFDGGVAADPDDDTEIIIVLF